MRARLALLALPVLAVAVAILLLRSQVTPRAGGRQQATTAPAREGVAPKAESHPSVPAAPEAKAPEATREWSVEVRGAGGNPVTGLGFMRDTPDGNRVFCGVTDLAGSFSFDHPAEAPTVILSCPGLDSRIFHLTQLHTVLHLAEMLPLEVLLVDAATGRLLAGGAVELIATERYPLQPRGFAHVLAAAPVPKGGRCSLYLEIIEPVGYAIAQRVAVQTVIARGTSALRVVVPLWPEALLQVQTMDATGRPLPGIRVKSFRFGELTPYVRAEATDDGGRMVVRGIPFWPGQTAHLALHGSHAGSAEVAWGHSRVESTTVVLEAVDRVLVQSVLHGRKGFIAAIHALALEQALKEPEAGTLSVRVLQRDGSPFRGALIALDDRVTCNADADGAAEFRRVAPGLHTVELREPGCVPVRTCVTVQAGSVREAVLVEPPGRSVWVRVVDAHGLPVPFASLAVTPEGGLPHLAFDRDGAQLAFLHADARGEAVLDRLPDWPVKVAARLGGLVAHAAAGPGDSRIELRLAPEGSE